MDPATLAAAASEIRALKLYEGVRAQRVLEMAARHLERYATTHAITVNVNGHSAPDLTREIDAYYRDIS